MFKDTNKAILIVDSDPVFLKQVSDELGTLDQPLILKATAIEAQKVLGDKTIELLGVFLSSNLSSSDNELGCLSVTRFSKQYHPSVPIHILLEAGFEVDVVKFTTYGGKSIIPKPVNLKKLIEIVTPVAVKFNDQEAISENDGQYVPIRAVDFVSGTVSQFNVFIKLSSGRYLKLLQAGDAFTPERLSSYLQKGVEHFYLRAEDQESYIRYCDRISKALAKSEKISAEVKMTKTMNHGQETMNFLRRNGLTEKSLAYASTFVGNVQNVIEKMNFEKEAEFNNFFKDVASYEHGVGTAMIASLISSVSGIESVGLIQIVGIAAMFHDIGLANMPAEVRSEDETLMDEEQKKLYHTHPMVSAEMLQKIPGTHPSVIQAVLQHHERRGQEKPFVPNIKVKALNRIAEIIGISDEYLNMMNRNKNASPTEIQLLMEEKVFPHFTPVVVDAFKKVYCKPSYMMPKKD